MKWGKFLSHQIPERVQRENAWSARQCLAWAGTLDRLPFPLLLLEIGPSWLQIWHSQGNALSHISCLPGLSASHRVDQWGPAFLVSLAQLVIKPGKNIQVPYKLDHLWIMNFGWQNSRPRAIVLKTVALTSVVTSFPPASSGLLWLFSLGSCSRTLQAELMGSSLASVYLYRLRARPYHGTRPLYPCLLPIPD